jgi:S1-C subfamily serine protease
LQVDKEKVASIIAQALKNQDQGSDRPDGGPSNPSASGDDLIMDQFDIHFERANKGLGLSIAGGIGSTPYKDTDEGIFISKVTAGGPAEVAGLRKDDKVLHVNG